MRYLQLMFVLGLVFCLTNAASAADKAKKKNKKGATPVAGVVQTIETDSVSVKLGKKKDPQATEKKIKLTDSTKFEKADGTVDKKAAKGKKGAASITTKPAQRSDVSKGAQVLVFAKEDTAERVVIVGQSKKAKKKAS